MSPRSAKAAGAHTSMLEDVHRPAPCPSLPPFRKGPPSPAARPGPIHCTHPQDGQGRALLSTRPHGSRTASAETSLEDGECLTFARTFFSRRDLAAQPDKA